MKLSVPDYQVSDMFRSGRRRAEFSFIPSSWLWILIILSFFPTVFGYYAHNRCFGTGDCIITTGYLGGGFNDEYHKWLIECQDGEAMTGIYDNYKQFLGVAQVWCYFSFPKKPPSLGIYPFYPWCNIRNLTIGEYYCYDKVFPADTVDTFVTALYAPVSVDPVVPVGMKCCRTPESYRIDYNRCQWKYTHDKAGEHYDGYWIVKCDTHYIMTGMGQAMNPWDNQLHFVWIQCCPLITAPVIPESRQLGYSSATNNYVNYGGGSF